VVDITLGGKLIEAGDGIIASNQSANRDEEIFPDPDSIKIYRKRGSEKSLGFRYGAHKYVAEWLARAELEIVVATIFQKLPNLRLAVPISEVKYSLPSNDVGISKPPILF